MSALISRAVISLLLLLIFSPCIYIYVFVDFYGHFLILFLPWMGRRTIYGDLLGSTEFSSKRRTKSGLDFLYATASRKPELVKIFFSLAYCLSW